MNITTNRIIGIDTLGHPLPEAIDIWFEILKAKYPTIICYVSSAESNGIEIVMIDIYLPLPKTSKNAMIRGSYHIKFNEFVFIAPFDKDFHTAWNYNHPISSALIVSKIYQKHVEDFLNHE